MANDVITPSNPLVVLIKKEKLEETPLYVNVSQRLCDKTLFQRMVRTRIDYSTWDCRSPLNPHVLAIYLEFIPAHGVALERFEKCLTHPQPPQEFQM
jgi:hypothetical protein